MRYVQDAAAVKTTGAQTIAGAKTFTGLSIWEANTGGQRFIKDAVARVVADFYTSTSTLAFVQRMTADGSLEFQGAGDRAFRIFAPVVFGFGDGEIYFENNAQDGNGAGLCLRTSVNPTGNGMIFSVRSSGGGLGFGVQQDGVVSGRADMYLGASDTGAGGNRVMHVGIPHGAVGQYCMASQQTGSPIGPGGTIGGASLRPAAAGHNLQTSMTGTWRCLGDGSDNSATLYLRIS